MVGALEVYDQVLKKDQPPWFVILAAWRKAWTKQKFGFKWDSSITKQEQQKIGDKVKQ